MLAILMSPRISRVDKKNLTHLVKNLLDSFAKFYGKLKPTFHFLTYYAKILLNNGPVIKFWSMRYESYHRSLKVTAISSNCKRKLVKNYCDQAGIKIIRYNSFLDI